MEDPTNDGHQTDSEESGKKGLTRRAFLGHAAVGAAGVAVGSSLFGTSAALADTAQSTVLPKKWTKTYDVVVIGTGVGLAAAIEAKKAGASVVILETADHIGGLYITAGGSFSMGGNNVVQQRDGIVDDNEKWYQDEMYCTGYRAQPELVRTLVENGADTVKWFQDLGIDYAPIAAGVLRPPIKRGITAVQKPGVYPGGQGTPNTGIAFTMVMYNEVKRLKIPVLMNTAMTKIYRNDDGVVVGVKAKTTSGKFMNIKARRGVVVCAGTWTDNDAMMQQYDPRLVGPDCYGDGGTPTRRPALHQQRRRRHPLRPEHRRRGLRHVLRLLPLHLLWRPFVLGLGTQPDRLDHERPPTRPARVSARAPRRSRAPSSWPTTASAT